MLGIFLLQRFRDELGTYWLGYVKILVQKIIQPPLYNGINDLQHYPPHLGAHILYINRCINARHQPKNELDSDRLSKPSSFCYSESTK